MGAKSSQHGEKTKEKYANVLAQRVVLETSGSEVAGIRWSRGIDVIGYNEQARDATH